MSHYILPRMLQRSNVFLLKKRCKDIWIFFSPHQTSRDVPSTVVDVILCYILEALSMLETVFYSCIYIISHTDQVFVPIPNRDAFDKTVQDWRNLLKLQILCLRSAARDFLVPTIHNNISVEFQRLSHAHVVHVQKKYFIHSFLLIVG
jgi:hypothetical protein